MIRSFQLLIAILILFLSSCHKNPGGINLINSQLKYKWKLVSEHVTFPDSPRLNLVYNGVNSDFFEFSSDGTVTINLAGTADSPTLPYQETSKYWFPNQYTFMLDFPTHYRTNRIETLTDSLLVFSDGISLVDNNGNATVHNGIRIDSLRR